MMRKATVLALVIGLVLGSAVTIAVALARGGSLQAVQRPSDEQQSAPKTVPVTRQTLVDSQVISGSTSWADTTQPVASTGIVTQMPVKDGAVASPGDILVAIDDQPVVALHLAFGMWRDLVPGDQGADVHELHGALAELGLYSGSVDDAISDRTFAALARIDPRLGNEPLPAASVAPVDPAGSQLDAAGVSVGTVLGERTIGVQRHGDRIAVSDGGMADRYVKPDQEINLFDDQGAVIWTGKVAAVSVESSQSLITVSGQDALPAKFAVASVVLSRTPGEVLAVPRVALTPQPDGSSAVTVVTSTGERTNYAVVTGMCTADLCEITPQDTSFPGEGALVTVR